MKKATIQDLKERQTIGEMLEKYTSVSILELILLYPFQKFSFKSGAFLISYQKHILTIWREERKPVLTVTIDQFGWPKAMITY